METTKKCKCCGRELPIDMFKRIGKRDGGYSYLTICSECMGKKQAEGRRLAKEARKASLEKSIEDAKKSKLSEFTPRQLMEELANRGYVGTLKYVEVHEIDITNI